MLSSPRHGSRCIYCAFRAQQQYRQALRIGRKHIHLTSTPPRHATATATDPLIRYTNRHEQAGIYLPQHDYRKQDEARRQQHKTPRFAGRTSKSGKIRKFLTGSEAAFKELQGRSFEDALRQRLHAVREELKDAPLLEELRKENVRNGDERNIKLEGFNKIWARFSAPLSGTETELRSPFRKIDGWQDGKELLRRLDEAYTLRGQSGLDDRLKFEFYGYITNARFTSSDIKNQQTLADLRYPSEWFPATRVIQRKIHLHVGPTNSGKTYHALQRLEQADTGCYAGPLRLLAHEVYTRMNAKGKPCSLITGEERRVATESDGLSFANLSSCTVEMMPLNKTMDVAVIDEIQMIGNAERGWAWTQALLGVKAKEVHLCGEARTVPLVRELCASVGEELVIHHYTRLSPLEVATESLDGDLSKLRKGDCLVSFSVMGIHSLRRQIERATGKQVATVYGSLPPETRAQQARLFNDPDNEYDYLVASDAVGMGLNLAIKRIIFEASSKFDGYQHRTLGVADIKQIAGRAGRYRIAGQAARQEESEASGDLAAAKGDDPPPSPDINASAAANDNTGYVTTLQKFDYPTVSNAMSSEPEPIRTAGLFPPSPVLERFAGYFPPGTPFSYILTRLHELSQMHTRFHLCGLKDQVWLADVIEPVKGLTITDRNIICSCPASKTDKDLWTTLMPALARCIADQSAANIVDIPEMPLEVLEANVLPSKEYLRELERLHKGVVGYLWLSFRFAGVFGQRNLASHVKGLVEEKIEEVLGKMSFTEMQYRKIQERRKQQATMRDLAETAAGEKAQGFEDEEGMSEDVEDGNGQEGVPVGERRGLEQQTSLTAGGDRFGGEEDLGIDDPMEQEVNEEPTTSTNSFAQWRRQQTREATQASSEYDHGASLVDAGEEGKEKALAASADGSVESITSERPSAQDVIADLPPADRLCSEHAVDLSEALSPEQNPDDLDTSFTPETELDESPMQTQEPSLDSRASDDGERTKLLKHERPVHSGQWGSQPPEHILEVDSTEVGRSVDSRP